MLNPLPLPAVIDSFSFTTQTDVPPGSAVASNAVTINGVNLDLPATISISGTGAYSIGCNSTFTTTTGMIKAGETVCVRYTAPPTSNTTSSTTITVNGVSATFMSTTGAPLPPAADSDGDGIPNAVENFEQTFALVKDNDVFTNARLFTMQQYRDFLGREGDPAGITNFTNQILAGTLTRQAVIESFLLSPEFQGLAAPAVRLYFATFLRIPDYDGLLFQINAVRTGTPLATVADSFTQSPEFLLRYGALTDAQYVTLLYQNILGRTPAQSEIDFHVNRLLTGSTRGEVLIGFSESLEYRPDITIEVNVTMMYLGVLRRAPEPAGFAQWVAYLEAGNTLQSLIVSFYNSAEYRNRGFLP